MSLLPFSVQPFVGTPLDDLRPLAYTLWKTDFLSKATSRDLAEFYCTKDYVPQGNRIDALNISKMYLELDQVEHSELYVVDPSLSETDRDALEHSELYVVDPTLSETDRDARLAEIKAYTTAIQREVIAREATKKLANQRSAAHTFLVSAISTNLRRLYHATTCPFEHFEHIKTRFESNPMDNNPTVIANYLRTLKFTDESCIDTLSVELIDLVKRYRVSVSPPSFNHLDPSAISSVDYHNHIWNYYTMCAMSDTFIGDKELWEVVTNSVATARAANQSVVVADVWASLRRIITNRLQRASALGDNGSAATLQTRTQLAAVTHAVATPAPPPQAITQADGSVHVMNAITIPSYAHRDCINHPGKSCFYCGVTNHMLPACPTLKSDYARNTMRPGFDRAVFDKHGSASQKKRKHAYVAPSPVIDNATRATAALIVGVFMTRLALLLVQPLVHLSIKAIASMALPTPTSYPTILCLPPLSTGSSNAPTHHRFCQRCSNRALPHFVMFLHLRPMNLRLLRLQPSLPSLTHRASSPTTFHLLWMPAI
ncbi:hypothetical protein DYB28_004320 [Aphanomyces astaci]|uniref:Uncharacterized protein n=1 Tax=Aphanomyces astaci TaxID=112090 RepID=A0A9X8E2J2_APHAT|nr:hypothetical protein DYB28_004320 [Aphanomyces astaci]